MTFTHENAVAPNRIKVKATAMPDQSAAVVAVCMVCDASSYPQRATALKVESRRKAAGNMAMDNLYSLTLLYTLRRRGRTKS